jgi:protein-S-isoprenylcysteine O-methyltransferase Ste14
VASTGASRLARFLRARLGVDRVDRGSLLALRIAFYGGLAICVFDAVGARLDLPLSLVGLMIALAGATLRYLAGTWLGDLWSERLRVAPDHRLVRRGLYRRIRNPSYLGMSLVYVGAVIAFHSLSGLLVFLLGLAPALAYRIHLEEALLERNFGDEYREYARRTKRLIPYIL